MKNKNLVNMSALVDIVLVLGVLITIKNLLLKSESLWTYAGPISLLLCLGIATWRLKAHKESWGELGLKITVSKKRIILWTVIALVSTIVLGGVAESAVESLFKATGQALPVINTQYAERFANLPGNFPAYLFWLTIAWVIGGFTEEMLFRIFLITRIEKLFPKLPYVVVFAIMFQAFIFGQQHYYYQGLTGWVATGMVALLSGVLYIAFKRNLWPLILSHGLANTLGLTMIFLSS